MQTSQTSPKKWGEKNVPTKYKSANILLSFYPTAPGPSEINFPTQSTSKIDLDLMSFFSDPGPLGFSLNDASPGFCLV